MPTDFDRLWLLGFVIFISSNILGSFVQIASLPVVILAPLGAVSLLWNAFFARLLLGDVFSPWMILGTILIAGGAILIAFFGIVPEQTRSLEDLLALFGRPTFIVYFSLLGFVTFVCLSIVSYLLSVSFATFHIIFLRHISPNSPFHAELRNPFRRTATLLQGIFHPHLLILIFQHMLRI
jgi:drug/metabolite transporter (DMT)-like permease